MNPFAQLIALASRPAPAPAVDQADTKTAKLLRYLEANPQATTCQIVGDVGLEHKKVWGLLKSHIDRGQVLIVNGYWSLNPDYLGADVERAVALLRSKGWMVTPPH